ncbi:MAG: hypothetical protein ACSHWW_11070 [Nonlabens sp.]|uniref:hypothetical protein n=1 Tax=Nonlabens sp. TaxID=1888209 RepID=UPI003EF69AE0
MKTALKSSLSMNWLNILFFSLILAITGCSDDPDTTPVDETPVGTTADFNNDGKVNILVLGTSKSINNATGGFAADGVATQLDNILSQDPGNELDINVSFQDIYKEKMVTYGLGQNGATYSDNFYAHSLMQYYYWPEGQTARHDNLAGEGTHNWDYVIIAADPYLIANLPGYYALGVHKIAQKVTDGGAKPLLLMQWPKDDVSTETITHFAEFTHRAADGAPVAMETIPAARAWQGLDPAQRDTDNLHPSPNGAYLTAATIYAHIRNVNATTSNYQYDDEIATVAYTVAINEVDVVSYIGERTFIDPFKSCDITDSVLNYNHTGSSSENGILNGLQWIVGQSNRTLVNNGTPPINFNYGRSNTNFEPNKRYNINPAAFDYSFGFPMQDNGNHGDVSMLYGLDKRINESNNGTDLGTALYMMRNSEIPHARAVPIRTLYAQLKEAIPSQSAYRDAWHMHRDLDKASAAFMYTILTGECVLGTEPTDQSTDAWKTWMAHKIGYETAYTVMYLKGIAPSCN